MHQLSISVRTRQPVSQKKSDIFFCTIAGHATLSSPNLGRKGGIPEDK
jgi:hypothetical protein